MQTNEVAGGYGAAFLVKKGQAAEIINTSGKQVVDTWAFNPDNTTEVFSVEHTRRLLSRLFIYEGDMLYSNRRTPMMTVEQDTWGGQHDMLCACCDPWIYKYYGVENHRSCHTNFLEATQQKGYLVGAVPNPLNLWMNVPVKENEKIDLERPTSKPGDKVVLRALEDVVVVVSACPMDITPVNGGDGTPQAIHYRVID